MNPLHYMWATLRGRTFVTNPHPLHGMNDIFRCGEILSEGTRPAQKLQLAIRDSSFT